MRSIRLAGPGEVTLAHVPVLGTLGVDEVEVQLRLAGLCGSDMPGFVSGSNEQGQRPAGYPAHECLGMVVASSGSQHLIGKRVIAIPNGDAGLSERFHASISKTHVLASDLPDRTAILAQPLATVLAALDRLGDVQGKRVAVIGLGPIGLKFGFILRQLRVSELVGFDLRDRSGSPLASVFDRIEYSVPLGEFDVVVEAVGHDVDVVNTAIDAAAHRGTVLFFGVPDEDIYEIKFKKFFRKCLQLVANVQPDWSRYLGIAETYIVQHPELAELVTDVVPVEDAQRAYHRAFTSDGVGSGKVLISAESWLESHD